MTFLGLINEVLIRMREPEVTSVSASKYTKLIGRLVNDAKRAVEDSADWSALLTTVQITTGNGTSDYSVTGSNERSTVVSVINQADKAELRRYHARDLIKLKQLEDSRGKPDKWGIVGASSGVLQLRFHRTPDQAYLHLVNCVIPQADLADQADTLSIPWEPVVLRAYAYAIKERGEDQGGAYAEALDQYRRALSRYLVLNSTAGGGGQAWRVI